MTPTQFVAAADPSPTQLTYAARVNPAPLTVGTQRGSLEVVITNQTEAAVAVRSVGFSFVVGAPGPEGTPLTPSTADMKWDVSGDGWALSGPPVHPPVTHGTVSIVLGPKTGHSVSIAAGGSVVVQIFDFATVPAPSTATVQVKETPEHGDVQFTSFDVTTFPHGFYFNGLVATAGEQAAAQVAHGQTVTLRWNSSVVATDNQAVLWSSATGGQQSAKPSALGQWTTPELTSDTVFVVLVSAHVMGGEPLTAALATAVAVYQPDLAARSVTAGEATVSGTLAAGVVTATGAVSGAALSATGTLSGATVSVTGAVSGASVSVTGAVSGASVSVTGAVSGASVTAAGAVSGATLSAGGGALTAGPTVLTSNDPEQWALQVVGNTVNTSAMIGNRGDGRALQAVSASSRYPAAVFSNSASGAGGTVTGVFAQVNGRDEWGVGTNGRIASTSGHSLITHLETQDGHRVVTSPLSLHPEVQVSGSAALSGGRAAVALAPDVADLLHHSDDHAYRVLITPAARCNGMAVVSREAGGFVVEELAGGTSDAAFDWLLIARRPDALGANSVAVLPEALPTSGDEPQPPAGAAPIQPEEDTTP